MVLLDTAVERSIRLEFCDYKDGDGDGDDDDDEGGGGMIMMKMNNVAKVEDQGSAANTTNTRLYPCQF